MDAQTVQNIQDASMHARSVLSPSQLRGLEKHTYKTSGYSILDTYVMVHFWNWAIQFVPKWIAPNLMTMTGMMFPISSFALCAYYMPTLQGDVCHAIGLAVILVAGNTIAPAWVNYYAAAAIFIYQTLDALDGKQARRTGTGSCLGELFDHGCDAFTTVMVTTAASCALQLGPSPEAFFFCFTPFICYYTAHWQTFTTGALEFGMFDVTEAHFGLMLCHCMTAYFGPSIWQFEIFDVRLQAIFVFLGTIGLVLALFRNALNIFVRSNGKTQAGTSVAQPLFPLACVLGMTLYTYQKCYVADPAGGEQQRLWATDTALFIFTFGTALAKLSVYLVISHMAESPHIYWDKCMSALFVLCLNASAMPMIPPQQALRLAAGYCLVSLVVFAWNVCLQIKTHFKIRVFRIPYPNKACEGFVDKRK